MADDAPSIRSINWRELFPFIHLFRAFRVAIHPSKLVLGFALLFLVYIGGRVLDAVWPTTQLASYSEVDQYTGYLWAHEHQQSFEDMRQRQLEDNASSYADKLVSTGVFKEKKDALEAGRKESTSASFRSIDHRVVATKGLKFSRMLDGMRLGQSLKDSESADDRAARTRRAAKRFAI